MTKAWIPLVRAQKWGHSEVMEFLRQKRRLAVLGGMAALACVALVVVLPALASNPGDYVNPPSGAGVLPVDVAVGSRRRAQDDAFADDRRRGVEVERGEQDIEGVKVYDLHLVFQTPTDAAFTSSLQASDICLSPL